MKANSLRVGVWSVLVQLGFAVIPAALAAADPAQPEGLPAPLPQKFTTRTILVRVVDAQNTKPVPDVTVDNSTWYLLAAQGADPSALHGPKTDAKGEAKVIVLVPPAEVAKQIPDFNLSLEHTSYAARTVQWHADGGGVLGMIPDEYTVRLQLGLKIGGVVTDEQNRPLSGAHIVIAAYGGNGYRSGESKVQEFSSYNSGMFAPDGKSGVLTDSDGRWSVANFPPDLEALRITVIRDDGSDINYSSQAERFSPSRRDQPLSLGELRQQKAAFQLPSGFTVKGRVVDLEGKPIAGAKVTDAYGMSPQPRGRVVTDGEGRFQFLNRRTRQCIWAVEAPGYALTCEVIDLKPDMPERTVQLQPAKPAVLQVVRADGKPAEGVLLQTAAWRNEGLFVEFKGHTGPDGSLVWSNAPIQAVRAMLTPIGGGMRMIKLRAGHEEKVTLGDASRDEIRVTVKATDAKTQQALPTFEVQIDKEFGNRFAPWTQGTNGVAGGTVRQAEFRNGMYPQFRLQIAASGYIPKSSEPIDFNDGDQEVALAADPDVPIKGLVRLAEGSPADGVYLVVQREPGGLFLNQTFQRGPVKPPSWGNLLKVQSEPEGTYELGGIDVNQTVVALHERGYAEISAKELRANPNLTLRPWERLEGVLQIGADTAKAGQRIGLSSADSRPGMINVSFDATTDPEGHFGFNRLPAGSYILYRHLDSRMGTIVYSHRQDVEITPGVPARVEMGGHGVRIEGKVRPSTYADLDWTANRHMLIAKQQAAPAADANPDWEDYVRRADYEAAARGRSMRSVTEKQYVLTFDKDGSFFVDDVPPGEYLLQIKVTEPPPRERFWMDDGKLIGMVTTNVVVPSPRGTPVSTLRLPPLVLPIASLGSGAAMPVVHARLLDGKPIDLGGSKDTPQVILFWAPWSEKSRGALGQFSKDVGAVSKDRVSAVAVALDEDGAEINQVTEKAAWKGTTAQLVGPDLLNAIATQSLDELPLVLIVDNHGALVTKTSNMARLGDALAEVLNRTSPTP